MGNLGSKNTIKIDQNDTTLVDMKTKCRELKKFNKRLENKIDYQLELMKQELAKKDKVKAIQILKYKKTLDNMLINSNASLMNLKTLIDNIEMSQLEVKIIKSLEQGKDALKRIQSEMPIDKVERIMDEVHDAIASQKEISDLLSDQVGSIDDDEILKEFELLEEELVNEVNQSLPQVPIHQGQKVEIKFPEVPSTSLIKEDDHKLKDKEEPMLA